MAIDAEIKRFATSLLVKMLANRSAREHTWDMSLRETFPLWHYDDSVDALLIDLAAIELDQRIPTPQ